MTRQTAKRKATNNGHSIGRFVRRNFGSPVYDYDVARCDKCNLALFANQHPKTTCPANPALDNKCLHNVALDESVTNQ